MGYIVQEFIGIPNYPGYSANPVEVRESAVARPKEDACTQRLHTLEDACTQRLHTLET